MSEKKRHINSAINISEALSQLDQEVLAAEAKVQVLRSKRRTLAEECEDVCKRLTKELYTVNGITYIVVDDYCLPSGFEVKWFVRPAVVDPDTDDEWDEE